VERGEATWAAWAERGKTGSAWGENGPPGLGWEKGKWAMGRFGFWWADWVGFLGFGFGFLYLFLFSFLIQTN